MFVSFLMRSTDHGSTLDHGHIPPLLSLYVQGMGLYVTVTEKQTIVCRLIVTVFTMNKRHLAWSNLASLCQMQNMNGAVMGGGDYQNDTFAREVTELCAETSRQQQSERIVKSKIMSKAGDGSANVCMEETELMYVKYFDREVLKFITEFFTLARVLTEDSAKHNDETSCDAAALVSTYENAFKNRVPSMCENYKKTLASAAFDGASVMLGEHTSVAAHYHQCAPNALIVHAVAHRLELALTGARNEVVFLEVLDEILRNTFSEFHSQSCKNVEALQKVATFLETTARKYSKLHDIRWMASEARAVEVWLSNFKPMVLELEVRWTKEIGLELTTMSRADSFLGRKVKLKNDSSAGRLLIAQVIAIVPLEKGKPETDRKLRVQFRVDRATVDMTKNELVQALAANKDDKDVLEESKIFQMYRLVPLPPLAPKPSLYLRKSGTNPLIRAATQYRVVKMFHLLLDLRAEAAKVSMVFQRDNIAPSDIIDTIDICMFQFERMKNQDGLMLDEFQRKFNPLDETFDGILLENVAEGEEGFQADREDLLVANIAYMQARFQDFLNNPLLNACRVLEHRHWPKHQAALLEAYGVEEIKSLADHFKELDVMEHFNLDEALHEWRNLKSQVSKLPFFTMKFTEFWTHMIIHYNDEVRFKNVLMVVLVVLMFILDTSCAERGYALMNRVHNATRNQLSLTHVNDIMANILLGPDLEDFDPKIILEMWLKGPKGENSMHGRYLKGKLKDMFNQTEFGKLGAGL